ncbi:RagB/SusD family nutrient uptake outer membrane protein [Chitinophaga rhizosphaerae]|uniref:RagB/SusD family nutrient uptake outer membrane protein n=1 Tax=Chitinophaga rhizosphaerae TaxID=1864947 RepID=UPI0013DEBD8E|nr:RagB/SusD family nutrient uptake outer membrane protein [Chitinophaga rhizosphaerae]
MKKITLYIAAALTLTAGGCKKFLEVTPKGKVLPTTVTDYEMFMNDLLLADAGYIITEFATDDLLLNDEFARNNSRSSKTYLWQKETMLITDVDADWNRMYSNIFYCNLVLDKIDGATEGTAEDKARLKAEAKIHRAWYYFHLANIYGKEYTPATAGTDLGAPLLLIPDLEAKTSRATVQAMYDQVLKDLNDAINTASLPEKGRNFVHPGKAAATALLARVQLYMGHYAEAKTAAEKALTYNATLLDHNTFVFANPAKPYNGVTNRPSAENHPENLFTRNNGQTNSFTRFMISPELLGIMGEKDLRFVFNFTRIPPSAATPAGAFPDYLRGAVNFSIGVPEMMLIKAEVLARNNEKDGAVALLNTIRQKRFKPGEYTPLSAATADEALQLVLRERRLELLYKGVRLFDLKRLNADPRFRKDLSRQHNGQTYSLPAGSPNYLMEIAPKTIQINPAILPNIRN